MRNFVFALALGVLATATLAPTNAFAAGGDPVWMKCTDNGDGTANYKKIDCPKNNQANNVPAGRHTLNISGTLNNATRFVLDYNDIAARDVLIARIDAAMSSVSDYQSNFSLNPALVLELRESHGLLIRRWAVSADIPTDLLSQLQARLQAQLEESLSASVVGLFGVHPPEENVVTAGMCTKCIVCSDCSGGVLKPIECKNCKCVDCPKDQK